jgi:hypothetical protein
MLITNYLRKLYSGNSTCENQMTLFALVGIGTVAFIKQTAIWLNIIFENSFYVSPPSSNGELWWYSFWTLLLFLYFCGYGILLMHNETKDNENLLPNISLSPFVSLVKALPIVCCWFIYYVVTFIFGLFALIKLNLLFLVYLFSAFMICVFPFILVVVADYTKGLKYDKNSFNIFCIFRILEISLGSIISLSLQCLILGILLVFAIKSVFLIPLPFKNASFIFAIRLGLTCIWNCRYRKKDLKVTR